MQGRWELLANETRGHISSVNVFNGISLQWLSILFSWCVGVLPIALISALPLVIIIAAVIILIVVTYRYNITLNQIHDSTLTRLMTAP